jgi:hypothetical protein
MQLIQLGCTAAQAALLLQANLPIASPLHDSLDGLKGIITLCKSNFD